MQRRFFFRYGRTKVRKGFTLIELLIAIAIIGTLASIVVIAVNPTRQLAGARDAKRNSDAVNLEKALYQYMIDKGSMPVTMPGDSSAAKAICREGTTDSSCLDFDLLTPDYLAAISLDATETNSLFTGYKAYQQVGRPRVVSTYLGTDGATGGGVTLITSGLVGYWKFDETSGTIAADSSGNGNTGTHTNGPTISATVAPTLFSNPRALNFDGVNDYVTLPSGTYSAFGTGPFTVAGWVKVSPNGDANIMISFGGSNTNYGVIAIGTSNVLAYYANGFRITDPAAVSYDTWYFLTLVGNGGADGSRNITLYKNGIQVGNTYTYNYNFPQQAFVIGANQSALFESWSGSIDDVRIYNRALTPSEITQIASGNG